jgi:hypothetical protein
VNSELDIADQAARLRALDVLAEQHRRIVALASDIAPARRTALDTAAGLSWRAFSRAEFEERVAELGDRLVAATVCLDEALEQVQRAKTAVLAGLPNPSAATLAPHGGVDYPATPLFSSPTIPMFLVR